MAIHESRRQHISRPSIGSIKSGQIGESSNLKPSSQANSKRLGERLSDKAQNDAPQSNGPAVEQDTKAPQIKQPNIRTIDIQAAKPRKTLKRSKGAQNVDDVVESNQEKTARLKGRAKDLSKSIDDPMPEAADSMESAIESGDFGTAIDTLDHFSKQQTQKHSKLKDDLKQLRNENKDVAKKMDAINSKIDALETQESEADSAYNDLESSFKKVSINN